MYNNVNVYMVGIDPVRIKAAKDSNFELIELSAESVSNGILITRTGSNTEAIDVLYEVVLFDTLGGKIESIKSETTINPGQSTATLSTSNMGLPSASTYAFAEFSLVADGNDYVLSGDVKEILQ